MTSDESVHVDLSEPWVQTYINACRSGISQSTSQQPSDDTPPSGHEQQRKRRYHYWPKDMTDIQKHRIYQQEYYRSHKGQGKRKRKEPDQ
jgi:hypothetical protein